MIINAIIITSTIAALLIVIIIAHSIIISVTSITVITVTAIICSQRTFMIYKNMKHIKNVTRFSVIHVSRCFLELSPLKTTIKFSSLYP